MTMQSRMVRALLAMVCAGTACRDFAGAAQLPAGQQDPSVYDTPSGASQQAAHLIAFFRNAVTESGNLTLTDELVSINGVDPEDQRSVDPTIDTHGAYERLQSIRVQANLTDGALAKFAAQTSPAQRSEVLAIEGYSEIYLADNYCSGIPLSTIDYAQNFTYRAGSSTVEVYRQAAALLDTAITLAGTDPKLAMFARVGRARALLALGEFDSAAHVVHPVGDTLTYTVQRTSIPQRGNVTTTSVADREGANGLPFVSRFDPRIDLASIPMVVGPRIVRAYYPAAYLGSDSVHVVIASSIEARLIEAEALLHNGDVTGWLATLNRLRTTGTYTGIDTVMRVDTTQLSNGERVDTTYRVDTLWVAGTGGVGRLGPLQDPGASLTGTAATNARVDLMFRERAYWLFLSFHRQGDLRRLIRQYGRTQQQVYPIGQYPNGGVYGSIVNFAIPTSESSNPKFKGCLNRDA